MSEIVHYTEGGWVKITKSGIWGEIAYNKGEYWQIVSAFSYHEVIDVKKENKIARIYTTNYNKHRAECEWIGMEKPTEELDYSIY